MHYPHVIAIAAVFLTGVTKVRVPRASRTPLQWCPAPLCSYSAAHLPALSHGVRTM